MDYPYEPNVITTVLKSRGAGQRKESVSEGCEVGKTLLAKDRGGGYEPRNVGSL